MDIKNDFGDGEDIVFLLVAKIGDSIGYVGVSCMYKVNSPVATVKTLDILVELTTFFELMTKFTKLKYAYLRGFDSVDLQNLMDLPINLQELKLRSEKMSTLPKSINQYINLRELDLSNNKLKRINKKIGILTNLEIINLAENELTKLPKSIGKLIKLKELKLTGNKLISLPDSIGKLTDLQILELGCNKLTYLPKSIIKLTNLVELYLREDSYDINNLNAECKILMLSHIDNKITNLPYGLEEIYLKNYIDANAIKIPLGCEINYDWDAILESHKMSDID